MNDYFLCLNDERLRQLTENELLPPELEELEQHITRCETCRRTMSSRARSKDGGCSSMSVSPGSPGRAHHHDQ